ncbi:hypothetical protein QR680_000244 [Steinernema hermaphroditum]|uniref:Uncharacterized protein n=1 Tax=Steinernema hermaphroditum TaxID=289476 RepID=A0AA39GTY2_9BILA|nr:hypothetical protein QR680_000244 [Steinernema hermaphroditum]
MEPRRGPPFPLNEGEDYNNMTVREYNNRLVDYYAATLPRRPITNRSSPRSNQSPIADRSPAPLTPDEQAPLPPLLTLQNDLPAEQPNNSRPGPNPISQQARNRYTNQQGAIRPSVSSVERSSSLERLIWVLESDLRVLVYPPPHVRTTSGQRPQCISLLSKSSTSPDAPTSQSAHP